MRHERAQVKAHELERVHGSFPVTARHLGVRRFLGAPFNGAFLNEEVEPLDVAVAVEQRVVQVEENELRLRGTQAATCPGARRRMPIAFSASAIAFTAPPIPSLPNCPMHPTRNVSTWVSFPG